MVKELRIYRADPYDPLAQALLVPPKARERPDLSYMQGPNSFFYLAERGGRAEGCIGLRNEGTFGLVTGFHFLAEHAETSLPDILLEQLETQARSLRLPILRAWIGASRPIIRQALVRNGFFPDATAEESERLRLFERPLVRAAQRLGAARARP